ncbi:MAG: DUF4296 domain-containing protein [Phycisphaerales bacterium]|nr:DUF4296 domain-containing protein [Phycisphaerales bacterium]
MKNKYLFIFFTLLLLSCQYIAGLKQPKGFIHIGIMSRVILDLMEVDTYLSIIHPIDSPKFLPQRIKMYDQIFKHHHVTAQQFYSSFAYYKFHPREQELLFDYVQRNSKMLMRDTAYFHDIRKNRKK